MARDHARFQVSIWDDDDFVALDVPAQHAYFMLASNKHLTYAGVLDYIPTRLTKAKGLTVPKLKAAVKTLTEARFVLVDEATTELLVRSYVRHDRTMERTNMGKAVGRALDMMISPDLRGAVVHELGRYYLDQPDLSGWAGLKAYDSARFDQVTAEASAIESGMASAIASDMPSDVQRAMARGK